MSTTAKSPTLQIGLTPRADSTYEDTFRVSETGALVVADGRGRFGEPTTRNQVFSVTTALAGTTVVAANVAPPAAGAATVLSILNPLGSGVNLAIVQGYVRTISATTGGAGAWAWCGAIANTAITAAEVTALKRAAVVGQGVAAFKAWSQAALTGGPVQRLVRPFPLARVAAAAAATSWSLDAVDNVDGALVVGPGGLLTLAPAAVGTAVVVGAGVVLIQTTLPEV